MSTVVYLENQNIQIVTGSQGSKSVACKQTYSLVTPEGSTINGMIMDKAAFTEFLKAQWKELGLPTKNVILVTNSNKYVGKTIEMPTMNKQKTKKFISREYADTGRSENSIFGYATLGKGEGKLKRIYAEAVAPELIKDYGEAFEKAGIKLSAIYSDDTSLINFVQKTIGQYKKTFLFIVAGANTFTLLLWVNGSFYHYNMSRCFHAAGTIEYAEDLARVISQRIQFMQANQLEEHLEKIYIAGVEMDELSFYMGIIQEVGIHVEVEAFASKSIVGADRAFSMIHGIAGLFKQEKNSDFLPAYIQSQKKNVDEATAAEKRRIILTITLPLLMMVMIFFAAYTTKRNKQAELDRLVAKNSDPVRMMDAAMYDELDSRNGFLTMQYESIQNLKADIATYPLGNSKVKKAFEKSADGIATINFTAFDAKEGQVNLTAKAASVMEINTFIKKLTQDETFKTVDYTGYEYLEDEGVWSIKVKCTLAEAAGREE